MKALSVRFVCLASLLFLVGVLPSLSQVRSSKLWTEVRETGTDRRMAEGVVMPSRYRVFRLNKIGMEQALLDAPAEFSELSRFVQTVIELPMPDGTFSRFRVEHSPVVEPGLAQKYPELNQTFTGRGIDDPLATVRFDLLPSGFHSMVLSPQGTVIVDPHASGAADTYISYYKRDFPRQSGFYCEFDEKNAVEQLFSTKKSDIARFIPDAASAVISGATLRTYRLALAATNEYAAAVGGNTVAGTLAAQVLVMNRVNGVYERDVAIRMVLVANNNLIVYAGDNTCGGVACTSSNDPYSNSSGSTMLGENTTNLNNIIGTANYDIGHVFSTGGGGVATLNGPCGSSKARGVTGLTNPVGDPFAIDYVAHEMGHQWGAPHTFNGSGGSCSGNRSSSSAFEPGSGITIMAYAGICGSQDLANNSIDTFHVKSLEDIIGFSQNGAGNACAVATPTGNTPPAVAVVGGPSFNIPKQTPFILTASATDANGDTVTYDWQQYDLGPATSAIPNSDGDGSARPIFRVYYPNTNPSRSFPSAQFIRNNANIPPNTTAGFLTGELLPQIGRTMNFQVIARDNRVGGGGISTATATVVVDSSSGPFHVTSPNSSETWNAGQTRTIRWNAGSTAAAPINAANVRITLSTDGGLTFPTVIADSTPNDGAFDYTVPAIDAAQARIRIEAVGNIFFDMSDVNFTISSVAATNGIIAGRIANAGGVGIPKVSVVITSSLGTRVAVTNGFGYFYFDAMPFGASYTITPTPRKGYTFSPVSRTYTHTNDATNIDFTGNLN